MTCLSCGHYNRCPRCNGWMCECCGAELRPKDGKKVRPVPRMLRGLTKHFKARWQERVGTDPTLEDVNKLMAESIRVHKQQKDLFRLEGEGRKRVKILGVYWHHEAGVIIWVDEDKWCAVTVISAPTGRSLGHGEGGNGGALG